MRRSFFAGKKKQMREAIEHGDVQEVGRLLEKGVEVNKPLGKNNWTPLHHAVREGHVKLVSLLLDKGAHANCVTMEGHTPTHMASLSGRMDILRVLGPKVGNRIRIGHESFTQLVRKLNLQMEAGGGPGLARRGSIRLDHRDFSGFVRLLQGLRIAATEGGDRVVKPLPPLPPLRRRRPGGADSTSLAPPSPSGSRNSDGSPMGPSPRIPGAETLLEKAVGDGGEINWERVEDDVQGLLYQATQRKDAKMAARIQKRRDRDAAKKAEAQAAVESEIPSGRVTSVRETLEVVPDDVSEMGSETTRSDVTSTISDGEGHELKTYLETVMQEAERVDKAQGDNVDDEDFWSRVEDEYWKKKDKQSPDFSLAAQRKRDAESAAALAKAREEEARRLVEDDRIREQKQKEREERRQRRKERKRLERSERKIKEQQERRVQREKRRDARKKLTSSAGYDDSLSDLDSTGSSILSSCSSLSDEDVLWLQRKREQLQAARSRAESLKDVKDRVSERQRASSVPMVDYDEGREGPPQSPKLANPLVRVALGERGRSLSDHTLLTPADNTSDQSLSSLRHPSSLTPRRRSGSGGHGTAFWSALEQREDSLPGVLKGVQKLRAEESPRSTSPSSPSSVVPMTRKHSWNAPPPRPPRTTSSRIPIPIETAPVPDYSQDDPQLQPETVDAFQVRRTNRRISSHGARWWEFCSDEEETVEIEANGDLETGTEFEEYAASWADPSFVV